MTPASADSHTSARSRVKHTRDTEPVSAALVSSSSLSAEPRSNGVGAAAGSAGSSGLSNVTGSSSAAGAADARGASDASGSNGGGSGSTPERVVLDDQAIRRALMRMAHEIVEGAESINQIYLIAVPNGGVPLARILSDNLESLTSVRVPLGILDTTLYRDDLSTRGSRPLLRRTEMPSSVDDRVVILVEDVVNTGRTIRAAMDALMDFGRPSHVRVMALVDRGHRELPIKIDYVGKNIPTQPVDQVVFRASSSDSTRDRGIGESGGSESAADDGPRASGVGALELAVRERGAS